MFEAGLEMKRQVCCVRVAPDCSTAVPPFPFTRKLHALLMTPRPFPWLLAVVVGGVPVGAHVLGIRSFDRVLKCAPK